MKTTRRRFLRTTLATAGALSFAGSVSFLNSTFTEGSIRLVPVEGEIYSQGMQAFMDKARFASPADAIAAIRSQRVRFAIEVIA